MKKIRQMNSERKKDSQYRKLKSDEVRVHHNICRFVRAKTNHSMAEDVNA